MSHFTDSSGVLATRAIWRREIVRRLRTLWFAKMLGTMLGIAAFLMAYFWVLRHPLFDVTIMPVTALDRVIGYHPETLPIYLSLWAYVSVGPALLGNSREIVSYTLSVFVLSVIGLGIFVLWPTAIPEFAVDWSQHPSISFLKNHDLAANACPSMHVAFSVLTAIYLEKLLREVNTGWPIRALNWLWCLGIIYSTVTTLQHVVLDVLGGTVLGSIVAALYLRLLRFQERGQGFISSYGTNAIEQSQR
jgi:membrane-associated phospholipid phosphatase